MTAVEPFWSQLQRIPNEISALFGNSSPPGMRFGGWTKDSKAHWSKPLTKIPVAIYVRHIWSPLINWIQSLSTFLHNFWITFKVWHKQLTLKSGLVSTLTNPVSHCQMIQINLNPPVGVNWQISEIWHVYDVVKDIATNPAPCYFPPTFCWTKFLLFSKKIPFALCLVDWLTKDLVLA